jgi:hypothetical protein
MSDDTRSPSSQTSDGEERWHFLKRRHLAEIGEIIEALVVSADNKGKALETPEGTQSLEPSRTQFFKALTSQQESGISAMSQIC